MKEIIIMRAFIQLYFYIEKYFVFYMKTVCISNGIINLIALFCDLDSVVNVHFTLAS